MVAQRSRGNTEAQPVAAKNSRRQTRPARAPGESKLNFSEVHALKTLPGTIEAWNREIVRLQLELSDSGLYGRDARKFATLSARLAEVSAARDQDEELWLALELKRGELASDS
jgi:ATP-binding cassette subfamily F protein uup